MFQKQKKNLITLNFVRCFNTPDGKKVLNHLRALTLENTFSPDTPAPHLYFREGQRTLVKQIENLIEQGKKN